MLTFLGHSTVRIELSGTPILTDPVTRRRIGPLARRGEPAGPDALAVEAVVVSHAHHDHLDLPSLRSLPGEPLVVVPRGLGDLLRSAGLRHIREVRSGERLSVGGVEVTVVPALHSGGRLLHRGPFEALGYVIGNGSTRLYFAGDTDLFDGMAQLGRIDVALLPVWGWGPRLGTGHMDPARAAMAAELIRPSIAVPIHWGTLWPIGLGSVKADRRELPAYEFAEAVGERCPEVAVRILEPGAALELDGRPAGPRERPGAAAE